MQIFLGIRLLSALFIAIIDIYSVACTDVCTTKACRSAANMLIEPMDTSVKPCDDFYRYACGNWKEKHPIRQNDSSTMFLKELRNDLHLVLKGILEEKGCNDSPSEREAKTLYKSCMNEEALNERGNEDIWNLLEEMGGMPLLGSNRGGGWNKDNYSLADLLAKTRMPIPFRISITKDLFQTSQYVVWIKGGKYGLPSRKFYKKGFNDKIIEAYTKYLIRIAILLGANETDASKEIYNVVQLEMSLAKVKYSGSAHRSKIDALENDIKKFDWRRYFKVLAGSMIQEKDTLLIFGWQTMKSKIDILQNTQRSTVINLILLRLIQDRENVLPGPFKASRQELKKALTGQEVDEPLWKKCVSYVNKKMPLVVGQKYIKRRFSENAMDMVTTMTNELKRELKSIIERKVWLDEKTITKAMEKVDVMGTQIGYPEMMVNASYISEIYKEYKFQDDQLFKNDLLIRELKFKETLSNYKTKVDVNKWPFPATTVNAMNHLLRNQIYIPAGIIQPPLFNLRYPIYMNYATVGIIVGHEIVHGLDNQGVRVDEKGHLATVLSDQAIQPFMRNVQCFIDQYNNYTDEDANMNLNGAKTAKDNICDNSGLKLAYMAFKKAESLSRVEATLPGLDLNNDQLFFLSAAHLWCTESRPEAAATKIIINAHSPGRFRVIGPMQNSNEFAKAFNCPLGSYMNPKDKCTLW